jgi:hypothetical protein
MDYLESASVGLSEPQPDIVLGHGRREGVRDRDHGVGDLASTGRGLETGAVAQSQGAQNEPRGGNLLFGHGLESADAGD